MLVGAQFTKEEQKSVLAVWRYAGYVMGIPEKYSLRDRRGCGASVQGRLSVRAPAGTRFGNCGQHADPVDTVRCECQGSGGAEEAREIGVPPFASAHRRQARL